uniref:DNA polymerase epsilon catalytic subunit n=1 Tax=Mesocestoides corti TaxID=53468 RepID=A0A5K3FTP7_MESCO
MAMRKWVCENGLKAKGLDIFENLSRSAFPHPTVLTQFLRNPSKFDCKYQSEAVYCKDFVHIPWNDGSIMHTYISMKALKSYEHRMKKCLDQIEYQIYYLFWSSAGIFGKIQENKVC